MVFSFFKKPPEKMVAKPSVVPRAKDAAEGAVVPTEPPGAQGQSAPARASQPPASGFSDFVFSEVLPSFHVEAEIDPVDADAEEAAMLYANRQDDAVRAVLENAIRQHAYGPGERLWLMLFDLYRLAGNKTSFEALEIDYARCFEKSPPAWLDKSGGATSTNVAAGSLLFRGELIGENAAAFDAVRQALQKTPRLCLDLSKIRQVDAQGCGQLLAMMQQVRKTGREIELLGRDALEVMLQARIVTGVAEDRECWLLFLELCQLQGQHEVFEDMAVDYAVTFEVSPPSWETSRIAKPEPPRDESVGPVGGNAPGDAYVLHGDSLGVRFSDLLPYAESRDTVVIDCTGLVRMDFVSAGALLNALTTIRQRGKPIVFHHPNRLVAELFRIVGLNAVGTLIFAKY